MRTQLTCRVPFWEVGSRSKRTRWCIMWHMWLYGGHNQGRLHKRCAYSRLTTAALEYCLSESSGTYDDHRGDVRSRVESQDVGYGIKLLVGRIQDCNVPVICLRLEMWGGGLRVSGAPPTAVDALLLFRASNEHQMRIRLYDVTPGACREIVRCRPSYRAIPMYLVLLA